MKKLIRVLFVVFAGVLLVPSLGYSQDYSSREFGGPALHPQMHFSIDVVLDERGTTWPTHWNRFQERNLKINRFENNTRINLPDSKDEKKIRSNTRKKNTENSSTNTNNHKKTPEKVKN